MLKKIIYFLRWTPSRIYNFINLRIRRITYGDNLKFHGKLFVRGRGKISIGSNVIINSSMESNPIGGDARTIFYIKQGAKLEIGNNVGISNSAFYSESSIKIEDNVLIGNSCKIYDSNFHSLNFLDRRSHNETPVSKPVIIKKDAFIGAHSIILKGVTVGEKSIVAAGSVVTKTIPNGEVWGGNPAMFIKQLEY